MTLAQIERLKQLRSKKDLEHVGCLLAETLKKIQKQAEKKQA